MSLTPHIVTPWSMRVKNFIGRPPVVVWSSTFNSSIEPGGAQQPSDGCSACSFLRQVCLPAHCNHRRRLHTPWVPRVRTHLHCDSCHVRNVLRTDESGGNSGLPSWWWGASRLLSVGLNGDRARLTLT